jgi:hypothetical protein
MGAAQFTTTAEGKDAKEAFKNAVEEAGYEYGHGGYTGTIAEKSSFVMVPSMTGVDPHKYANELIEKGDSRIGDKWGPAGCISLGEGKFLFFGYASE